MNTIQQHLTEYQKQIEQHKQAIRDLSVAIQALERLQQEQQEDTDDESTDEGS